MPELPEVETIRRQLEPLLVGAEIIDSEAHWSAKFSPATEAVGHEIVGLGRRGKYLIFALRDVSTSSDLAEGHDPGSRELIVHLGMTGRLALDADPDLCHPHLRARWRLADGRTLTFHDTRRFGRIHVVASGDHRGIPTLAALGPEPFEEAFTGRHLAAFVQRGNRHLKTVLLAQRAVAGIGNIYADEALWLAGINPSTRRLSLRRAERLVVGVREALQSGLDHGGTTLRDYVDSTGSAGANQHRLRCYGRAGEPCERCGSILRRRILDARSTTWCPSCQGR